MGTIAPSASQAVRPRQAQSAQAGRMRATICKRGFDNSRNTFTQQQFSLARHCQQALLRQLPYALVSPRGLIRELRPHTGHIEEMRP